MRFIKLPQWSYRRSFLYLLIFVITALVTLSGVRLAQPTSQATLGPFRLSAFPSGLALYVDTESWLYAISPLNDFVATPDGSRTALLNSQEFASQNYSHSLERPALFQVFESIGAQFGIQTPWYSFTTPRFSAKYTTAVRPESIRITRWLTLPRDARYTETGSTFKFNPDDFVYEPSTNRLFTLKSTSDIGLFTTATGIFLDPVVNDFQQQLAGAPLPRIKLSSSSVRITNLAYPGSIQITAGTGQSIFINSENNTIELVNTLPEPTPRYATTALLIEYVPTVATESEVP